MSGFSSQSVTLWKISGLNFHSVWSLNCLDNTSASVFIIPGICETDIHTAFSLHHIQICFVMSLQSGEHDPPMLDIRKLHMYCLSRPVHVSLWLFLWNFSKRTKWPSFPGHWCADSVLDHRPPILWGPQTAPQPPELAASVFISTSGFLLSIGKEDWSKILIHQFSSSVALSVNLVRASKLPAEAYSAVDLTLSKFL